jgi:peroxiredoxin (alkyl hydroperoxide reductase subunit C)
MITAVGTQFPEFNLNGVDTNNEFVKVNSDDLDNGKWSVIYFYPKDFTFICPTEIAGMDDLVEYANVIGISGDNEFCKLAWKKDNDLIGNIQHTLLADCGLRLARDCGVVDYQECVAQRATFIINPKGIIQHVSVNALDTGRNAQEVLRTLKALQAGGLTGCAWKPGDDFVI